jgi:hypothetical protein
VASAIHLRPSQKCKNSALPHKAESGINFEPVRRRGWRTRGTPLALQRNGAAGAEQHQVAGYVVKCPAFSLQATTRAVVAVVAVIQSARYE